MHVKKLDTNLKYDREVDLSPCTVITGANAAGKTGIVESLSLVTTGESVRLGKDGKKALAATVGSPDTIKKDAQITAELSDGGQATWTCSGTPSKATRPKRSPSEQFASVSRGNGIEAIRAGGSKLTDWLVSLASQHDVAERRHAEILLTLPPVIRGIWLAVWEANEDTKVDCGKLLEVKKELGRQKRDLQKKLKAIEEARESGQVGLSGSEQKEFEELEQRNKGGENALPSDRLDKIMETLQSEEYAQVRFALQIQDVIQGCLRYMKSRDRDQAGCPCCHQVEVTTEQLEDRLAKVTAFLEHDEEKAEMLIMLMMQAARDASNPRRVIEPLTADERKRLLDLRARKVSFEKVKVDISSEGRVIQDLETCKQLISAADAQRRHYAAMGADVLQKLSSRILPKKLTVEARLRGSDYVLGLERRGFWHPIETLSGAESAMLLAAVEASACTSKDTPLRMLVIDDVWFDRTTLIELLKALTPHVGEDKALTQVIVCCVEWRGKPPKGWTRLDLDAIVKEEEMRSGENMSREIGDDDVTADVAEIMANGYREEPKADALGL